MCFGGNWNSTWGSDHQGNDPQATTMSHCRGIKQNVILWPTGTLPSQVWCLDKTPQNAALLTRTRLVVISKNCVQSLPNALLYWYWHTLIVVWHLDKTSQNAALLTLTRLVVISKNCVQSLANTVLHRYWHTLVYIRTYVSYSSFVNVPSVFLEDYIVLRLLH